MSKLGQIWQATRRDLLTATGLLAIGGTSYALLSSPAQHDSADSKKAKRPLPHDPSIQPLTEAQVSGILKRHERILHPKGQGASCVLLAHQNYVPSNPFPGEDTSLEAVFTESPVDKEAKTRPSGTLIGVFDGHSGRETSSALKDFLGSYVDKEISQIPSSASSEERPALVKEALKRAFKTLDGDIIKGGITLTTSANAGKEDAQATTKSWFSPSSLMGWTNIWGSSLPATKILEELRPALAGACALAAYVEDNQLYVACTGDSRAVLGKRLQNGALLSVDLSMDQTTKNTQEYARLLDEHPGEDTTVVKRGRVLGGLMPTRAFGDARYKWPLDTLNILSRFGLRKPPSDYKTPPYVTAEPVVTHVALEPGSRDAFLILATDGLWDELSSEEAVARVGSCELGQNAATDLISFALGGGDPLYLAHSLAIPPPLSRKYRDDVTATIVFFGQGSLPVPDGADSFTQVDASKANPKNDNLSPWLAILKARSGSKL